MKAITQSWLASAANPTSSPSGMKRDVLWRWGRAALSLPFPSSLPFSQMMRAVKVRFTEALDTWRTEKSQRTIREQGHCTLFTHEGDLWQSKHMQVGWRRNSTPPSAENERLDVFPLLLVTRSAFMSPVSPVRPEAGHRAHMETCSAQHRRQYYLRKILLCDSVSLADCLTVRNIFPFSFCHDVHQLIPPL